jgi:hypothetical protein
MGLDFENLYGRNTIGNTALDTVLMWYEISTLLDIYRLIRLHFICKALLIQSWLAKIYINLPVPLDISATPPAA